MANKPVLVNFATVEELQSITGIGEAIANKIVETRTNNGGRVTVSKLYDIPNTSRAFWDKLLEHNEISMSTVQPVQMVSTPHMDDAFTKAMTALLKQQTNDMKAAMEDKHKLLQNQVSQIVAKQNTLQTQIQVLQNANIQPSSPDKSSDEHKRRQREMRAKMEEEMRKIKQKYESSGLEEEEKMEDAGAKTDEDEEDKLDEATGFDFQSDMLQFLNL